MSRKDLAAFALLAVSAAAFILLALLTAPARAEDRATLDACERMLAAKYEACKAESEDTPGARAVCSAQCSTRRCGLAWAMSFGDFQDRRIEETARIQTGLTGLTVKEERLAANHVGQQ